MSVRHRVAIDWSVQKEETRELAPVCSNFNPEKHTP
jgi:hypothetical protein